MVPIDCCRRFPIQVFESGPSAEKISSFFTKKFLIFFKKAVYILKSGETRRHAPFCISPPVSIIHSSMNHTIFGVKRFNCLSSFHSLKQGNRRQQRSLVKTRTMDAALGKVTVAGTRT